MITQARIAAFLSTSALCLGLTAAPASAAQRDASGSTEARPLAQDDAAGEREAISDSRESGRNRSDRSAKAGQGRG